MNDKRALLNHFLAALAYRTQKALRAAAPELNQPQPASPDEHWPGAPADWTPLRTETE